MLGGLPTDLDAADAWRSTTFQLPGARHAFSSRDLLEVHLAVRINADTRTHDQ